MYSDIMSSTDVKSGVFTSAETISGDQDLLTEILLRVPAKSLLRFKCVSKQWHSLISDPKFSFSHARLQKIMNPTASALLLNKFYSATPEFQLVPLKSDNCKVPYLDYLNVPRVKILQSCNGLLICSSSFLVKPGDKKQKEIAFGFGFGHLMDDCSSVTDAACCGFKYFVCNPTTKHSKILPLPKREFFLLSLAYDPSKSPHYKVVRISMAVSAESNFLIDFYSSETESWSALQIPFQMPSGMIFSDGIFLNDAIHWDNIHQGIRYFGESQGHLLMAPTKDTDTLEFDVLIMATDYSGWSLIYHVDLHSMSMELIWDLEQKDTGISVLSLDHGEKEKERIVVILVDRRVISYNLCDGTHIKICDLEPGPIEEVLARAPLNYDGCHAHRYFESLTCV